MRHTLWVIARNDVRQYDDLADVWWDKRGVFATLHAIAEARASLVPTASRDGAVLLDLACGAGLLAPHIANKGYIHVGVDLTESALIQAQVHDLQVVQGNVLALPFADACADVVCAGEIFEHVYDLDCAVAEACRVLKPGGTLVIDTLANTAISKFVAIFIAERVPGGAPRGIHDPNLLVDRERLMDACARHGVQLEMQGLRPSITSWIAWRLGRREVGKMIPTRFTSVLFQAWGRKR